tara:strand:- start:272 stop:661 length:390 start_codon:yes stop_codon:yes gene_type:complete
MKLDVYQIRGDYEEADNAYRALALKGSKNFEPEMLGVFRKVCTVDMGMGTDTPLEFVFQILNSGDEDLFQKHVSGYNVIGQVVNGVDQRRRDMHSLSVGDIVVYRGRPYMCDPQGFTFLGGFIKPERAA